MGKVHHDSGGGSDDDNAIEKTFTKGPWTQAEDDLLIAYVDQHGDGNWNAVQKHSGLSRCGKSCRLRWVNHLRPDLKKGAFTDEEELRVIELHAVLGNKWARMAGELPGRTDNEIKNFWNTRLKRLQRQGLPVYPDEVREQAMNAAAQSGLNTDSLDGHYSQDSLEADNVDIPELDFQLLPLNECSSYYKSMLRSVPTNNGFMKQRPPCFFQPNMYNVVASTSPYMSNRINSRESDITFDFTSGSYAMNEESSSLLNYPFVESTQEQLPDSHLVSNATYASPSEPIIGEDEKLELPSIQCFDSNDSWGAQQSKPMLELESDNTLVQSPITDQTRTSSLYDGLLESIVFGSSVERQATNTNSSDSPLFESSVLGHTELTPAKANTTGQNFNFQTNLGYFGSNTSNERRSFDGDWIRLLLGEDTYNKE